VIEFDCDSAIPAPRLSRLVRKFGLDPSSIRWASVKRPLTSNQIFRGISGSVKNGPKNCI